MNPETYQPILDWIANHPHWSGFIVFLISLSESLAVVGLVVPGVVMMTAIGGMMGAGILPFWLTLMWAILGAIVGDGISYWLGYHYHQHLRDFWPFKQFPGLLARGEAFFHKHGGKSIIFGRFVGPVRPMIPVIAGMLDMKPKRFLFFNILSAIVWAPLYSLPGILIGASLGSLSPKAAHRVGFLILFVLLLLWLIYLFARTIGKLLARGIEKSMHRLWVMTQKSPSFSWLRNLLKVKQGTEHGQLGLLLFSILSFTIFIIISLCVIADYNVNQLNDVIYQISRALYSTKFVDAFTFITGFGEPYIVLSASAVVGLAFILSKRYTAGVCWLLTIFLGYLIGDLVKNMIGIQRPEGLHTAFSLSYPSGHVLGATLFFGLSAFYIQDSLKPNFRWIPWSIGVVFIILIALSRIYLGIHWFTDIMGGLFLGLSFITLGYFCYRLLESRPIRLSTILIPGISVLCIAMIIYSTILYPQKRGSYSREWTTHTLTEKDWWNGKGFALSLFSRSGAIKRMATVFDLQWLGNLTEIETSLEKLGFKTLPKLSFNSSLVILEDNPSPELFPIAPKFHRDRLPALILSKPLNKNERLVVQLWQSDFYTSQNTPLWVGTLRKEVLEHPLPLTSIYKESSPNEKNLQDFQQDLKQLDPKFNTEIILFNNPKDNLRHPILLIKSP